MTNRDKKIAKLIDHTCLKADATRDDIVRYCNEAKKYGFASVCVNSSYTPLVSYQLKNVSIKTCTVIGFPLGAMSTRAKEAEAEEAVEDGSDEIDMVMNIGLAKSNEWGFVKNDILAVRNIIDNTGKKIDKSIVLKVILETCLLTDEEKVKACNAASEAHADFVKTSTGFSTGGATIEDICLLKSSIPSNMKVKASGGIRTPEQAVNFVNAGADRIGAGNGILLLEDP